LLGGRSLSPGSSYNPSRALGALTLSMVLRLARGGVSPRNDVSSTSSVTKTSHPAADFALARLIGRQKRLLSRVALDLKSALRIGVVNERLQLCAVGEAARGRVRSDRHILNPHVERPALTPCPELSTAPVQRAGIKVSAIFFLSGSAEVLNRAC
jgi:hypothetical protein